MWDSWEYMQGEYYKLVVGNSDFMKFATEDKIRLFNGMQICVGLFRATVVFLNYQKCIKILRLYGNKCQYNWTFKILRMNGFTVC